MITAKFNHPNSGDNGDAEQALRFLEVGGEYTLNYVSMGLTYTTVWVSGCNRGFNSVLFDFYENGKKVELQDYPEFNLYY